MHERILCYLGPSLDLLTAKSIVPSATFLPPCRHADLISDAATYAPTHILLIDGEFNQNLPPYHKEISFCALKGIKVYGASSMGALRAAELCDVGAMIGAGVIFHWYWEGIIEADDEVALMYHRTPSGDYVSDSCPLVNIRAGLSHMVDTGQMYETQAFHLLSHQIRLHYSQRHCEFAIDQKRLDAIELLSTFRDLDYQGTAKPDLSYITPIFRAMLERERRITVDGTILTLQNVDSYISLHHNDHDQILWDSKNRSLSLIMADLLNIQVSAEDIEYEWSRFCARHHLLDWDRFQSWLKSNLLTKEDFDVLTIQNARIRRLHNAYITTTMFSRQTRTILDYLRTHDQLEPAINACAHMEKELVDRDNSEMVEIDMSTTVTQLLSQHLEATGLQISGSLEQYLRDTGIGTVEELRVCLERYALARQCNK